MFLWYRLQSLQTDPPQTVQNLLFRRHLQRHPHPHPHQSHTQVIHCLMPTSAPTHLTKVHVYCTFTLLFKSIQILFESMIVPFASKLGVAKLSVWFPELAALALYTLSFFKRN